MRQLLLALALAACEQAECLQGCGTPLPEPPANPGFIIDQECDDTLSVDDPPAYRLGFCPLSEPEPLLLM